MAVESGFGLKHEHETRLVDRDMALFTLTWQTATHPKNPNRDSRIRDFEFGTGLTHWNKLPSKLAVEHGANIDAVRQITQPIEDVQVPRVVSMRTVYGDSLGYNPELKGAVTDGVTLLQIYEFNLEGGGFAGSMDHRGRVLETYALPRIRGKQGGAKYPEFDYGWYPHTDEITGASMNEVHLYQVLRDLFAQMYPHTTAPGGVVNR